jgi:two-component system response regulator LytT
MCAACPIISGRKRTHAGAAPCRSARALHILATLSILRAMPITTLIVDDEKPARDELAFLLKSFPELRLIGQGKNGTEAVAMIQEHEPELVFLDVQMPGLDGFGVIKKLIDRKARLPHFVFATAYDNYAVQAFEVNAADYILKPFDKARLAKAVARVKKALEADASPVAQLELLVNQIGAGRVAQPAKLIVKTQQRLLLVDADDVIYASIADGLITVVTKEVEGSSNCRTIEELQDSLDSERFWRPHRSYLVNIDHIKEVVPWFKSSYMLKMADRRASEIPVSRAQTRRLRELVRM